VASIICLAQPPTRRRASLVDQHRRRRRLGAYTHSLFGSTSALFCRIFWVIPITKTTQVEIRSGRVSTPATAADAAVIIVVIVVPSIGEESIFVE